MKKIVLFKMKIESRAFIYEFISNYPLLTYRKEIVRYSSKNVLSRNQCQRKMIFCRKCFLLSWVIFQFPNIDLLNKVSHQCNFSIEMYFSGEEIEVLPMGIMLTIRYNTLLQI